MSSFLPGERIVVVSPHSDDGVLSLGATIASWVREGARVELLTVFALDPTSEAPAGGWDMRAGFRTEGEAAVARRAEDAAACSILGATASWLPFGSVDYQRHGDEASVQAAIAAAADGMDALLLPGFPLTQPDHEWLGRALVDGSPGRRVLGLYVEQPYARRTQGEPRVPSWAEAALGTTPVFEALPMRPRDQLRKWRAIRCYSSQLPLLGMHRSVRRGPHSILRDERIAWVPPERTLSQG